MNIAPIGYRNNVNFGIPKIPEKGISLTIPVTLADAPKEEVAALIMEEIMKALTTIPPNWKQILMKIAINPENDEIRTLTSPPAQQPKMK